MPEAKGSSEHEGKAWGHGQFANMPQEVMMDEYRPAKSYHDKDLDDTMRRLDEDSRDASKGERRGLSRGMY